MIEKLMARPGEYVVHVLGNSEMRGYFTEFLPAFKLYKANAKNGERLALFYCRRAGKTQGIAEAVYRQNYPYSQYHV